LRRKKWSGNLNLPTCSRPHRREPKKWLTTVRARLARARLRGNEFRFCFSGAWPPGVAYTCRARPKPRYRQPNGREVHPTSLARWNAGNQTHYRWLRHILHSLRLSLCTDCLSTYYWYISMCTFTVKIGK
jgi:hypothetical protein